MTTKNLQVMFHVSIGWELPLVMTLTEPTLDYSTNGFISLFVLLTITYSSSLQCILVNYTLSYLVLVNRVAMYMSSSETHGQLFSRDDGIFMGESLQQERESPWALTLTERVPEASEIPPSDWPEKYFSGQSAKRNSRATLMSPYTRLFSSSNAVVAWPVQLEHF